MSARRPLFRPLGAWILGALLMILYASLVWFLAPFKGGRRAFWRLAPSYLRAAAILFGIRPALAGWETLPEEIREGRQPAIFIANHSSYFDPPLLVVMLPCRPVFLAKRELAWVPVLGWTIELAGFIFIDRQNRRRAAVSIHRAALRIRAGQSIIAFPEGTRTRTGELLPFKKGLFHLALAARVPIVPLGIRGGREILPQGTWRAKGGPYDIQVGSPLEPSDYANVDALRDAAEQAVAALLA